MGGTWRVGGLLALSRAFGDAYLKVGVARGGWNAGACRCLLCGSRLRPAAGAAAPPGRQPARTPRARPQAPTRPSSALAPAPPTPRLQGNDQFEGVSYYASDSYASGFGEPGRPVFLFSQPTLGQAVQGVCGAAGAAPAESGTPTTDACWTWLALIILHLPSFTPQSPGVIAEPYTTVTDLTADDGWLIVCSDGLLANEERGGGGGLRCVRGQMGRRCSFWGRQRWAAVALAGASAWLATAPARWPACATTTSLPCKRMLRGCTFLHTATRTW